jgi:uncharacterized protein involved in outer membrane biogenesis
MKSGKLLKKVLIAVTAVVVVLVIGLVVFLTRFDAIARAGIEKSMSWALQVPVTVASVHVNVFSGEAQIRGLVIGNPEVYHTPQAFAVDTASARLDLGSFRTDQPIIHEIVIQAPAITLEQGLTESNLSRLAKNASRFSSGEKPETQTVETTPEAGKKVKIERLVIENGRVEVSAPVLKGQVVPIPLPPVTLTDLGGKKDVPATAEALSRVFLAVLEGVAQSGKGRIPDETLKSLNTSLGSVKAISEELKKSGDQFRKTNDEVNGLLKGLIPRKKDAEGQSPNNR